MGYTPWNLIVGHYLVTQQQQQHILWCRNLNLGASQGAQWVKEPACNAGDTGLIPVWEDPLENGKAIHSSILAWRIRWTEAPGWLQSIGHK